MSGKKDTPDAQAQQVKRSKAIGPFDIIKLMFTDKNKFDNLSNSVLARNFFMINRVFAINFPMQAQCFNKTSVDQGEVVRAWGIFGPMKLGYGKVPPFVYTKGAKASQQTGSEGKLNIDKDQKRSYCIHYGLSLNDFDDMLLFYPKQTLEHFNSFVSMMRNDRNDVVQKL